MQEYTVISVMKQSIHGFAAPSDCTIKTIDLTINTNLLLSINFTNIHMLTSHAHTNVTLRPTYRIAGNISGN